VRLFARLEPHSRAARRVQITASMLLSSSNSTSTSRRSLLPVPNRFLAALSLALGLGVLAPSMARADEAAAPAAPAAPETAVEASSAAPVTANVTRPLTMHDLGTGSSFGAELAGGMTQIDFFGTSNVYTGVFKIDAELALQDHVKLFASFPVTALRGEDSADGVVGHGNLTLGAQLQGGSGDFDAGVGASFSAWGQEDSFFATFLHYDIAAYDGEGKVIQGHATAKVGKPEGFFQAELDYTTIVEDRPSSESERERPEIGTLRLGGGIGTPGGSTVLGELAIMRSLNGSDSDNDNLYIADLGLRQQMGASGSTWATKASLLHAEGLTSFMVGFELRTDLPVLGGE
jgi:hypothetical protein